MTEYLCISLMIRHIWYLFIHRNICPSPLPIFKSTFFYNWVKGICCIFWILHTYQTYGFFFPSPPHSKHMAFKHITFLLLWLIPFYNLCYHFIDCFLHYKKVFTLMWLYSPNFAFADCVFGVMLNKAFPRLIL